MGKIYKLQCQDGHFYIGSTTKTLQIRLSQHKATSKQKPNIKLYKYIENWSSVTIELLEECDNYKEREDQLIRKELDNPLCLNSVGSCNNPNKCSDYYKNNKEKAKLYYQANKEKAKLYYQANKEKIAQQYLKKKATDQDSHTLMPLSD